MTTFRYHHLVLPVFAGLPALPPLTTIGVSADKLGRLLLYWVAADALKTPLAALLLSDGSWNEGPAMTAEPDEKSVERREAFLHKGSISPATGNYYVLSDELLSDDANAIRAFSLTARGAAKCSKVTLSMGESFEFTPLCSDEEVESIKASWALARIQNPETPKPSSNEALVNHAATLSLFETAFEAQLG